MAKRFTDTDKWKKQFIRGLEGPYKLLWLYILDDCDMAGVWPEDIEVAEIRIGEKIDRKKAIESFGDRVEIIGNKWFIKDFIPFQYGELKDSNRMHVAVSNTLKKFKLTTSPTLAPCEGLTSPQGQGIIQGIIQGKGQGQGKEQGAAEEWEENWMRWGNDILTDNDQYWQKMRGRKVTQDELNVFYSVAIRNKWTMDTQQNFRRTLHGFSPLGHTAAAKQKVKLVNLDDV